MISLVSGIFWIFPYIAPKQSFDSELQAWGKSLKKEKYINQYRFSGDHSSSLNLTLENSFDNLSVQEKYNLLEEKVWVPFSNEWEYLLMKYDYSAYSDSKKAWVEVSANTDSGSYKSNNGTFLDKDGIRYDLDVLTGAIKKGLTDEELRQEEEIRHINLLNKEPTEGMFESDLPNTKWGTPTKIEKSKEYDIKRPGYRYIVYTWEVKDETGYTYEIKDAFVEEGIVTSVHDYKYTKPKK
jgi:hypothetical protein